MLFAKDTAPKMVLLEVSGRKKEPHHVCDEAQACHDKHNLYYLFLFGGRGRMTRSAAMIRSARFVIVSL